MSADNVARGIELIRTLPQIMPEQASGPVAEIYEDTQRVLRIPFVNFTFRTLANYPDFLQTAWAYVGPIARTAKFERAADQLREMALLDESPRVNADLSTLGDTKRIRAFTDTIHYVLPKLLLIATILEQALAPDPGTHKIRMEAGSEQLLPLGPAEGTIRLHMADPQQSSPRVQSLLADIRSRHGHPEVASYFRVLANWPDFLQAAWAAINPIVGSSAFEERKRELLAMSVHLASGLVAARGPVGAEHVRNSLREDAKAEILAILAGFRSGLDPDLLLDVTLISSMFRGREEAAHSPFSAV